LRPSRKAKHDMKTEVPIEQLLRWRLAQAEAEAPPVPRAAHLLELARPWWETWPERFQTLVERLGRVQIAYGHAMSAPRPSRSGHPVPVLVVRAAEELETSARVLYLNIRDGRLRLRFQLAAAPEPVPESFEVTFVSETDSRPLFSAQATRSVDSEYSLDAGLSEAEAKDWETLKVTDWMPFRFMLRADADGG
jgi:hypothetical protein